MTEAGAERMRYEEMVGILLERVPEFRELVANEELFDPDLSYVVFGGFASHLRDWLSDRPLADPTIQQAFQLLNEMGNAPDRRVVDLAKAGVFEILTDEPHAIRAARQLLYGRAIDHFEDVIRLWGIEVRDP